MSRKRPHGFSHAAVTGSGASPEQQLAAILILEARESCHGGCLEDCEWLAQCALPYLALISPGNVDVFNVLDRLLATLPNRDGDEPVSALSMAADRFVQLVLGIALEQEVKDDYGRGLQEMRFREATFALGDSRRHVAQQTMPIM